MLETKQWDESDCFVASFKLFPVFWCCEKVNFISSLLGLCRVKSLPFFLNDFQFFHGLVQQLPCNKNSFYLYYFLDILWLSCFLTIEENICKFTWLRLMAPTTYPSTYSKTNYLSLFVLNLLHTNAKANEKVLQLFILYQRWSWFLRYNS